MAPLSEASKVSLCSFVLVLIILFLLVLPVVVVVSVCYITGRWYDETESTGCGMSCLYGNVIWFGVVR